MFEVGDLVVLSQAGRIRWPSEAQMFGNKIGFVSGLEPGDVLTGPFGITVKWPGEPWDFTYSPEQLTFYKKVGLEDVL